MRDLNRLVLVMMCGCGRIGFDAIATDAVATPDGPPQPAGARLWLAMDTDPNVAIIDSAQGHDVACSNITSCPGPTAGVHGGGFLFGDNQLVVTYAPDLAATAFTVATWGWLASIPAAGGFACAACKPVGMPVADLDSYALCVDATAHPYFDSATVGTRDTLISTAVLAAGEWHHFAITFDGTKHLYFDGVDAAVPRTIAIDNDSTDLVVGADNISPSYYWNGALDDVLVYDRALTAAEIRVLATK